MDTELRIQSKLIEFYTKKLREREITIIKSSRIAKHLRFRYTGSDLESFITTIHPAKILDTNIRISGKYATKILQITSPLDDIPMGSEIYIVNAITSGVVVPKSLNPHKINFSGKEYTYPEFDSEILNFFFDSDIPNNIKNFLYDSVESIKKTKGNIIPIKSFHADTISNEDILQIKQDFGELLGPIWLFENQTYSHVKYPNVSNLRLIDYWMKDNNILIPISSKSGKGGPPSIDVIGEKLKEIEFSDPNHNECKKVILMIKELPILQGIIDISKYLNLPGYKHIKELIGNNFFASDVESYLSTFSDTREIVDNLMPFWELVSSYPSQEIISRIIENKGKRLGIILYPLGQHIVKYLNGNEHYQHVLNVAAKSINAIQLYIQMNKDEMRVEMKEFKDSKFRFNYNGKTNAPNNKKISFIMVK